MSSNGPTSCRYERWLCPLLTPDCLRVPFPPASRAAVKRVGSAQGQVEGGKFSAFLGDYVPVAVAPAAAVASGRYAQIYWNLLAVPLHVHACTVSFPARVHWIAPAGLQAVYSSGSLPFPSK